MGKITLSKAEYDRIMNYGTEKDPEYDPDALTYDDYVYGADAIRRRSKYLQSYRDYLSASGTANNVTGSFAGQERTNADSYRSELQGFLRYLETASKSALERGNSASYRAISQARDSLNVDPFADYEEEKQYLNDAKDAVTRQSERNRDYLGVRNPRGLDFHFSNAFGQSDKQSSLPGLTPQITFGKGANSSLSDSTLSAASKRTTGQAADETRKNNYAQMDPALAEEALMGFYATRPQDYTSNQLYTTADKDRLTELAQQLRVSQRENKGSIAYQRQKALEEEAARRQAWFDERADKYANIPLNDDFEQNISGWEDVGKANDQLMSEAARGYELTVPLENRDADTQNALKQQEADSSYNVSRMSPTERKVYRYLQNTEGDDAAKDYMDYLSYRLNARNMNEVRAAAERGTETTGGKWVHSALSVPANLAGGALGAADYAIQNVRSKFSYRPIDYNSGGQIPGEYASAVRENTQEDMGNVGRFVYGTAMSMADSAASMLTIGKGGGALLGLSAGRQGVKDAIDAGATDSQAIAMGLFNGAAEMIFENIGIDNLYSILESGGTRTFKAAVKSILGQALSEGTEEVGTTLANTWGDAVIMADKSEINRMIDEYMSEGAAREQATRAAWLNWAQNLGMDFLGGLTSGALFGIGGTIIANAKNDSEIGQIVKRDGLSDGMRIEDAISEVTNVPNLYSNSTDTLALYIRESGVENVSDRALGRFYRLFTQDQQNLRSRGLFNVDVAEYVERGMEPYRDPRTNSETSIARDEAGNVDVEQTLRNAAQETTAMEVSRENEQSDANTRRAWEDALPAPQQSTEVSNQNMPVAAQENAQERSVTSPEESVVQTQKSSQTAENGVQAAYVKGGRISDAEMSGSGAAKNNVQLANGETAQVQNISVSDNGVVLETSRGKALADDVQIDDPSLYTIVSAAEKYDTQGAQALFRGYENSDLSAQNYVRAFESAYESGHVGLDYGTFLEKGGYATFLDKDTRMAAYAAGQRVFTSDKETASVRGGVVEKFSGELTREQRAAVNALNAYGRAIGRTINIVDSIDVKKKDGSVRKSGANATFNPKTNEYTIALDAQGQAYVAVALHESVHDIAANQPQMYDMLHTTVMEYLKMEGEDIDALRTEWRDRIGDMSDERIDEEIIGNTVPVILSDKETAQDFAERFLDSDEKKSAFRRLIDSILDFLKRAYDKLKNLKSWRTMKTLEGNIQAVQDIREVMFDALDELRNGDVGQNDSAVEIKESRKTSKKNKKPSNSTASPLPRGLEKQGSVGSTHIEMMASTAAAELLGVDNITQKSDGVNKAISALGEIYASIESGKPVPGAKKAIQASNLVGNMVRLGILERRGQGGSAYRSDSGHTLRVSNHTAHAENFVDQGENLSIALFKKGKMNDFLTGKSDAIEAVFRKQYLDEHPDVFKNMIGDIARFIATGEYHDTAGALMYHYSGSESFVQQTQDRMLNDAIARETKMSLRDESSATQSDTEYMTLAEAAEGGDLDAKNELQDMVFEKAYSLGYTYRRNTRNAYNPQNNAAPYYMFVDTFGRTQDPLGDTYGPYRFVATDKNAIDVSDIADEIQTLARDYFGHELSDDELSPPDIVDSAGMWDNMDFVQEVWDNILERIYDETGVIPAVKTADGLLVFGADGKRIKSADPVVHDENGKIVPLSKRFDESSDNIRYSLRDTSSVDIATVENENAQLREANEELRKQFKRTQGVQLDQKAIRKMARDLLKQYDSSYDVDTLTDNLSKVFDVVANGGLTWDEASSAVVDMCRKVLEESSSFDAELYDYDQPVREYLKNVRLEISDDMRGGIELVADNGAAYRRGLFGIVGTAKKGSGVSIDQIWREASEMFPAYFSEDAVNPEDQAERLYHLAQRLKKSSYFVNAFAQNIDAAAYDMMLQIGAKYPGIPHTQTFADKFAAKVNEARAKTKKAYDAKLAQLRAQQKTSNRTARRLDAKATKIANRMLQQQARYEAQLESQNKKIERMEAARDKVKDTARRKKYRDRIAKNATALYQWLAKPTDKAHVPENIRAAVTQLVRAIDLSSGTKYGEAWRQRLSALADQFDKSTLDAAYQSFANSIDPDLTTDIRAFVDSQTGITVSDMDADHLQTLSELLNRVKKAVTEANKFHAAERSRTVQEVAIKTREEFNRKRVFSETKSGKAVQAIIDFNQADAVTLFHYLGKEAETIYNAVRQGFDEYVFHVRDAQQYAAEVLKKAGDKKQYSKTHKFHVDGKDIELSVAQIMTLYVLSQRPQAAEHLYDGGIVLIKRSATGTQKEKTHVRVTKRDVSDMIAVLTDSQKTTADALQRFLQEDSAAWGNDATMTVYGYRKFGEDHYFPIDSDRDFISTSGKDSSNNGDLYALRNWRSSKSTVEGASNPLIVGDIFDVWTKHVSEMAKYGAYLAPMDDMLKWYNWRGRDESGRQISVRESLNGAFGKKNAAKFVETFIKNINGSGRIDVAAQDKIFDTMVRNAKAAAVGANLSVAIQQPTAYARAYAEIDAKYLALAFAQKPNMQLAQQYCPIAQWKAWGFFDVNVGPNLKSVILGDKTWLEKIREVQMFLPELGDNVTWGYIWNACALEVADKENVPPDQRNTEEFYQKVGRRMSEVIDKTQVVDSPFTRSFISSNKGYQAFTAFQNEPMKSYNMLTRAAYDNVYEHTKETKKHLRRSNVAFVAASVFAAMGKAIISALRRNDDKKGDSWAEKALIRLGMTEEGRYTYGQKWMVSTLEETADNLNPLNTHWLTSAVVEMIVRAASGTNYSSGRIDEKTISSIEDFAKLIKKLTEGKDVETYRLVYKGAEMVSYLTGVGFHSLLKDFKGIANALSDAISPDYTPTMNDAFILIERGDVGSVEIAAALEAAANEILAKTPSISEEKAMQQAESDLRSKVTNRYKDDYINAFEKGYTQKAKQIAEWMYATGLYEDRGAVDDVVRGWLVDYYKEAYLAAKTDAERSNIFEKLYATKKWRNRAELKKAIRGWTEATD